MFIEGLKSQACELSMCRSDVALSFSFFFGFMEPSLLIDTSIMAFLQEISGEPWEEGPPFIYRQARI